MQEIIQQQVQYKEGSLEYLLAELLKEMCQDPQAAELIEQDLKVETMNLKALGEHVTDYAKKQKHGSCYGMSDNTARQIIREFYKLPSAAASLTTATAPAPAATAAAPAAMNVNLLDLLG